MINVYLGLCCLGLIAFSTLSASAGLSIRGDYLIYGRYGEPGYAVMLVTGIAWLGSGSRRRVLALGAAPLVAAAGAFGLMQLAPAGSLRLPVNYVNVLSLVVYLVRVGGLRPYAIVAWSLPVMLALMVAFAAVRRAAWLVPLVVVLVFVGTVRSAVRHWLNLVTAQSAAVRADPPGDRRPRRRPAGSQLRRLPHRGPVRGPGLARVVLHGDPGRCRRRPRPRPRPRATASGSCRRTSLPRSGRSSTRRPTGVWWSRIRLSRTPRPVTLARRRQETPAAARRSCVAPGSTHRVCAARVSVANRAWRRGRSRRSARR